MTVRATALTTNLHDVLPIYHHKLALPCGGLDNVHNIINGSITHNVNTLVPSALVRFAEERTVMRTSITDSALR